MKKQTKKKLENDLATAIQNVLAKYDSHAVPKTKKVIKQSVKSVTKKFNKTIKALTEKKEAVKAKRKKAKKASVRKSVAPKPVSVKYPRPKKKTAYVAPSKASTQPLAISVGSSQENQ
ncbi:MAG: hypothetical protein NTV09_00210 [Bacteroidetes bacterium]|nr:hypothetical protein [Bacteroidota bacterium]